MDMTGKSLNIKQVSAFQFPKAKAISVQMSRLI